MIPSTSEAIGALLAEAVRASWEDGDPTPSPATEVDARAMYEAFVRAGISADDIDLGHDAMGGLGLTVGDASAHVWVSFRNNGSRTVSFTVFGGEGHTEKLPPPERLIPTIKAFLEQHRARA